MAALGSLGSRFGTLFSFGSAAFGSITTTVPTRPGELASPAVAGGVIAEVSWALDVHQGLIHSRQSRHIVRIRVFIFKSGIFL